MCFSNFICIAIFKFDSMNVTGGKFIFLHTQKIKLKLRESDFHLFYLYPYGLQLNYIEDSFSNWKNIIKVANCSTIEELKKPISFTSLAFSKIKSGNYFLMYEISL